ncbi:DNA-3-methyladenine glycosylase II [Kibdelosporangium aridum]|uniref:DNA-3-methyladenine glycosylase II n=1 Tax=Kibdelosporangium aridum TaxID=2030 RepID=A0A1W2EXM0_KIBAR|nr:DNA-3-methyladenine glycosylase II [Kibdelosporangium aridum]
MDDGVVSEFEVFYRAMASRDPRFDGRFVVAVTSTGVYCRPSCPSRTPQRRNTRFFTLPAAAEAAGFRACRRCRPDVQPTSPEWNVRGDLVGRALRLIAGGGVDDEGVAGLARRLAVSERHLHRQLVAEVGVGPQMLAISRRARVARMLIESTALPMSDVAFAAGYASVRQFNHGMRAAFGCPPSELRNTGSTGSANGDLVLRLRYRPPLAWQALLKSLATRALSGIEVVSGRCYRRAMRLPHGAGVVTAEFDGPSEVTIRLVLADLRDVTAAVARCREIFDLDADPLMIGDDLGSDPVIGPLVQLQPGLRVPGCADGFELAVRAVSGHQATLVSQFGEPLREPMFGLTHTFPSPETLAEADLAIPQAETIRALAKAVCTGELSLDRGADREESVAILLALPGIEPWTATHIAMHALGDPDVFPHTDPELLAVARQHGIADSPGELQRYAERWRPWRSYAAMHLLA